MECRLYQNTLHACLKFSIKYFWKKLHSWGVGALEAECYGLEFKCNLQRLLCCEPCTPLLELFGEDLEILRSWRKQAIKVDLWLMFCYSHPTHSLLLPFPLPLPLLVTLLFFDICNEGINKQTNKPVSSMTLLSRCRLQATDLTVLKQRTKFIILHTELSY